jgi:starch-binding outer membrane protein, SusD/RagB family
MMPTTRTRAAAAPLALLLAALPLASCGRDRLLEVNTPDQIRPEDAASAAGAAALRAAAIGNFNNFFGGTTNVGANLYGGLISDELVNARPGADHIDQRAFNENTFPNTSWNNFSQAYTQLIRARAALRTSAGTVATTPAQIAQLNALSGMALTIAGELFCNGVPLSNANDVEPEWETVTNAQMFQRAVVQFDSAAGAAAADVANLARVGKGRALVDLGQYAQAAAAVAAVPTSFVYNAEYSATSLVNTIFDWMVNTANFSPSDVEGGNGLNFVSARDPRVAVLRDASGNPVTRLGQDGSTRAVTIQGYPNGAAPTKLATGVEARLIEAEAALSAGNTAAWLAALNAPRADAAVRTAFAITQTAGAPDPLPPLADPGTAAARVDLLFRERAFWMYLTTHRVGDLRRLVRQYNRPATAVWPTGAYFKGGTYGTDQNIKPSVAETNNPTWKGCADRNP